MEKILWKKDTLLMPIPAALITCRHEDKDNIITLAWVGVVCSDPPTISCGIRPSRKSYGMIRDSKEFVVNIPGESLLKAVDRCGTVSGRDVDKFEDTGLTPLKATEVGAPLIAECPINMECRLVDLMQPGIHHLFLGEVVAVHVNADCTIDKKKLDIDKIKPLSYCPGAREYRGLGPKLGGYGKVKDVEE
ncbi:flavin reductase family protein [Acidobacteriota bacterium]